MLALCSRLPGTLTRSSCQAFQGSLSLSRGWKCSARDKLPWQPHCFQTLKGREKSWLLPAHQSHHQHECWPRCPNNNCGSTGHMCSLGIKGDRALGERGTEQRREKKMGPFSPLLFSANTGAYVVPKVQEKSDHAQLYFFVPSSLPPPPSPPPSPPPLCISSSVVSSAGRVLGYARTSHFPLSTAGTDSKPDNKSNFWALFQVQHKHTALVKIPAICFCLEWRSERRCKTR